LVGWTRGCPGRVLALRRSGRDRRAFRVGGGREGPRAPPAGFPSFGLGLWRLPAAAAIAELALVLWGTYAYWRAAIATTGARKPARLATAALLISGLVTLGLDLLGT
jgi:hypothetical protein